MENIVECIWPWSRRFSKYSKMFTVKGKNRGFDFSETERFSLSEDTLVRVQSRSQLGEDLGSTRGGRKPVPRLLPGSVGTAGSSVDRRREGIFIRRNRFGHFVGGHRLLRWQSLQGDAG